MRDWRSELQRECGRGERSVFVCDFACLFISFLRLRSSKIGERYETGDDWRQLQGSLGLTSHRLCVYKQMLLHVPNSQWTLWVRHKGSTFNAVYYQYTLFIFYVEIVHVWYFCLRSLRLFWSCVICLESVAQRTSALMF